MWGVLSLSVLRSARWPCGIFPGLWGCVCPVATAGEPQAGSGTDGEPGHRAQSALCSQGLTAGAHSRGGGQWQS